MYSFGIVLWGICTGGSPERETSDLLSVVQGALHPCSEIAFLRLHAQLPSLPQQPPVLATHFQCLHLQGSIQSGAASGD